jgi:hypothetical protein
MHGEAKRLFLGKGVVVGVGIANRTAPGLLTFLLREDHRQTRRQIKSWAELNKVAVEFLVTGPIQIPGPVKEE